MVANNRHKACEACGYYYRDCECGGSDGRAYAKGYTDGKEAGFEKGKCARARDAERDQPHLYKTGKKSWRMAYGVRPRGTRKCCELEW